jgi:nitroimidazol reductase NimA-like FMN-containing flavoprotein (pyridoxamine 5'-phosphate oxidase superfamily)
MSTGVSKQPSSHFRDIPRDECEALPAAQRTGRVAWNAPDGPQVLPVTYGVYAGDIVFRASPHGVLAQLGIPTKVAFEIDDIDQAHGAGGA